MTERDQLRKHFDLKPCPNPSHEFRAGRLIVEWVWAEDCWAQLVGDKLQTLFISLHSTKNVDGLKVYSLVIWKLKIAVGVTK